MSKVKKEDGPVGWTYSGDEVDWDGFDRRMTRYMRKKLDTFGERLWMGEITGVESMSKNKLATHVLKVYQALRITEPKEAKALLEKKSDFFKKDWHIQWLARQANLMVDHIEDHALGQAEVEVVNYSGDKKQIRLHLYKQFGAGSGGDIHSQELDYEKGMPDANGIAFKPGADITVKLRQLEGSKIYFWKMCDPAKRKKYVFCQEPKLVRIVLEHVNEDYRTCVDRLLDYVKVQKLVSKTAKKSASPTAAVDADLSTALDRSFNDDWLPSWASLQACLIDEYKKFIKDGKFPSGKVAKGNDRLPVAFGSLQEVSCYACGTKGHKSGDPSCKAGPFDVAPNAPKDYKDRKDAKKRKAAGEGNQGGMKKAKGNGEKKHCFDFAKGSCRRGAQCKFSHEKEKKAGPGKMFSPEQKKVLNVMLSAVVKKKLVSLAKESKNKKGGKEKEEDDDSDFHAIMAPFLLAPCVRTLPRNPVLKKNVILATKLHDVDKTCGIDSDAGMSISTLEGDFLWLDRSPGTVNSLAAPSGINGGSSVIGGIGPMIVKATSGEYLIDPNGVYIVGSANQPNFRVMATQRLKSLGIRIVGCFEDSDDDVLQDRVTKHTVKLHDEGPPDKSILVLRTVKVPRIPVTNCLKQLVKSIKTGSRTAMVLSLCDSEMSSERVPVVDSDRTLTLMTGPKAIDFKALIFNLAKCTIEERSRLMVRRFGYCNSELLVRMCKDPDYGELPTLCYLNENNQIKDAAKYRALTHERNDPALTQRFSCWGRTYVDGYGGGQSMGEASYEGAIGGYLFRCPSTGEIHHKLYASHEQFPAAVFQFLTHVEGEGNRCHELYVDTFSVNISAELEEVVGLFQCRIVPISAGTPQELAFVETAHRVIAGRSRAMMIGAPHLPAWCWALADKHAILVGRFLPQSTRQWKCSYFLNTKRIPDWRHLCLHVFGAPCRFAPMGGPVHKRAEMTEEGFFVGVQHPMVLIIRKSDMKLISCSEKKFIVYESSYTAPLSYSPTQLGSTIEASVVDSEQLPAQNNCVLEGSASLQHVQSIKSMSSHTIPVPNTTAPASLRQPTALELSADSQNLNPGEGLVVPEHTTYEADLASGIQRLKADVASIISEPGIREKVMKVLDKAKRTVEGEIEPKQLSKGKKQDGNVSTVNIVPGKRKKPPGPMKTVNLASGEKSRNVKQGRARKSKFGFQVGDGISAKAELFDGNKPGSFSKDNPGRHLGVIKKTWPERKIVEVEWLDGSLNKCDAKDLRLERPKMTALLILQVMVTDAFRKEEDPLDKDKWPKNFFEALVRPDWRSWVEAVKKEIQSWLTFDAYTQILFAEKPAGSSIVPLGELYTRKRDLTFKFRQYLMGNMLRKGKDYDETFSCCISWDGIRWCTSLACAMSKEIRGCDAVTGFLQAREQYDLYAYLPSHGQYSSLSYEELAVLRQNLLQLIEKEGIAGLKKFAAQHKKESRNNPKTCYRLNSSIYGAPSANHEWDMLFQHAHINGCGLTLSEIEPSLYVRIETNDEDEVIEWIIVNIWTDDVRYFGTDNMLKQYEENLQKHVKVKFLGVPKEFVGTEILQDLDRGLCELKAPKYWEGAALKFQKYFENGIKERLNPLSIIDEKTMLSKEVSDEEAEKAKHLPYRELLGVISYHASCTKLEMRYAVSICGRHRGKWGSEQFNILKKMFEYGYTTRHTGLIYSKGLDAHGINVLSCHADSGHSLPRSYGSTAVFMNGAAITFSAKRHTLTGCSTCHDETIEFSIAGNKVAGLRNMMEEMHLAQDRPTVIYQDNEAAIMIAMNRGSLSGQSRHIDRKVLTCRNKIEDGKIIPVYLETARMIADIGTKALGDKQFAYLRDQLTGYSLVKIHHPTYKLPTYIV